MKTTKLIVFLFALFLTTSSIAQKFDTDGYWAGVIPIKDDLYDEGFILMLYVQDGKARQVEFRYEEDKFYFVDHDKEVHSNLRNNMSFTWMNEGGAWSETQSFMLSSIDNETMNVLWIRQVNNEEDYSNTDWNVIREGTLVKFEMNALASLLKEE